jgi:hypothetical protein
VSSVVNPFFVFFQYAPNSPRYLSALRVFALSFSSSLVRRSVVTAFRPALFVSLPVCATVFSS